MNVEYNDPINHNGRILTYKTQSLKYLGIIVDKHL